MNILVLNGSPKGSNSITLQTVLYLQKRYPAHSFEILHVGARFKMYDDRQFCYGHRAVTIGMPVGYLVSGNNSREPNLQTIPEARAQVGTNFLAAVATDEFDPNGESDRLAKNLTMLWITNMYRPRISTASAA